MKEKISFFLLGTLFFCGIQIVYRGYCFYADAKQRIALGEFKRDVLFSQDIWSMTSGEKGSEEISEILQKALSDYHIADRLKNILQDTSGSVFSIDTLDPQKVFPVGAYYCILFDENGDRTFSGSKYKICWIDPRPCKNGEILIVLNDGSMFSLSQQEVQSYAIEYLCRYPSAYR